jgi:hypothetical protein
MASITHMDVEVRPSIGFQTVGYTARVQFDTPLDTVEALAQVAEVREMLTEQAHEDLNRLVESRKAIENATPAFTQPSPAPAPAAAGGWRNGKKPKGGDIRYIGSDVVSSEDFRKMVEAKLPDVGLNPAEVTVFDDRVGNYGLESGNEQYSAGKIKVKDDAPLAQAMQGKKIVGSADFNNDGSVYVSLSKDAKAALQALEIAANIRANVPA